MRNRQKALHKQISDTPNGVGGWSPHHQSWCLWPLSPCPSRPSPGWTQAFVLHIFLPPVIGWKICQQIWKFAHQSLFAVSSWSGQRNDGYINDVRKYPGKENLVILLNQLTNNWSETRMWFTFRISFSEFSSPAIRLMTASVPPQSQSEFLPILALAWVHSAEPWPGPLSLSALSSRKQPQNNKMSYSTNYNLSINQFQV